MLGCATIAWLTLAGVTAAGESASRPAAPPARVVAVTRDGAVLAQAIRLDADGRVELDLAAGASQRLDAERVMFVRFDPRPVDRDERAWLCLADGQRWAGMRLEMRDDGLRLAGGAMSATLPTERLVAVFFAAMRPEASGVVTEGAAVVSRTGEIIRAPDVTLTPSAVTLELDPEPVDVPLARVRGVVWVRRPSDATANGAKPTDANAAHLVVLRDGQVWRGRVREIARDRVQFAPASGEPTAIALADVEAISLTGRVPTSAASLMSPRAPSLMPPRAASLAPTSAPSSLPPHSASKRRSVAGGPLRLGAHWYRDGIGLGTGGRVDVPLGGRYVWFVADVGVDAVSTDEAACTLVIVADGREVFRREGMRRTDGPARVCVSVAGVKNLTLMADGAGEGNLPASGDFADAILLD